MVPPAKTVASHQATPPALLECLDAIFATINSRRLTDDRRLDIILRHILDYLGVEQGSIMMVKRRRLEVRAASRKELIGVSQPLDSDSIAAHVARSGEVVFIPDITKDQRFAKGRRTGSYRTKSLLSAPIRQDKKILGVINITDKQGNRDLLQEDITYLLKFSSLILVQIVRQEMNQAIKQQRNTLKKRNRELRRREAMQNDLSRMLIHDLKGPLAEVVANLDILSYSVTGEERELLENAQLACDRAVRMAANLGSVAKIEDGKMQLIEEPVPPGELLTEAATALAGLARIQEVTIVQQTADDLPVLLVDRVLLLRVLQNLLTNAIDHSPPQTVITLGVRRAGKGKKVEFFVQDQGPGIPMEAQEHIFEKYARLDNSASGLGTGLGLYFCRLAVSAHRGRIHLDSSPGHGSRFSFTLPAGR